MLGYIRESIQGWIAAVIIFILIVPFALWGINKYFGPADSQVVATVNGDEISSQEFQSAFYAQRDRMRQMFGGRYDADRMDKQIKKQALDGLIERTLMLQQAHEAGFGASKDNVIQSIKGFTDFQRDGQFSRDLYLQLLESNGRSAAKFELDLQRDIIWRQIYSSINSTAFATDFEVENLEKLQSQTRDIDFIVASHSNYKDDSEITEENIKKYYDEHSDEFKTQEQVSINYVELDSKKLDVKVEPSEEELQQYYNERAAQFNSPEERRTSHILITVDEGADEKTVEAARKKAEEIKAKLDKGEKFEDLATKYSQDPGSKKLGGDIGFFGKGSLDPNYEKTMFEMKVGEISPPILSKFGFHIIKLTDIHAAKVKPLAEVKDEILASLKTDAANKKYYELADKLTNLAYEVPDSLQDAAGAISAQIQTTPLFARVGGSGIAANPKVAQAAFSDEVLVKGYNSEPIELGENHVIVLRVKDRKPAQQKTLEEVKDEIKSKLGFTAERTKAKKVATEVLENMRKAETVEAAKGLAAKELKAAWKTEDKLTRNDSKVDRAIVNEVFKTAKPAENKLQYGMVQLGSGDVAVFVLRKVEDGDVAKIDAAKKTSSGRTIANIYGSELFSQYLAKVKASADIKIFEERL